MKILNVKCNKCNKFYSPINIKMFNLEICEMNSAIINKNIKLCKGCLKDFNLWIKAK